MRTKDFVKAPTKWDGKDFAKLGMVALATYLSSFADEPLQNEMQKDQFITTAFLLKPEEFGERHILLELFLDYLP
jgi:hypothetical protein